MTATLFLSGNDLSENYTDVVRQMKANTFDVYSLIPNSDIEIKVRGRRGPCEQIGENRYLAGESYDSFDVWVKNKITNRQWESSCIAEDLRSFNDAVQVARMHNAKLNASSGSF